MAASTAPKAVSAALRVVSTNASSLAPFAEALRSVQAVLFDCDGVLWRGTTAIDGASDTLCAVEKAGKHAVYVTNNSSKERSQYVEKISTVLPPMKPDASHIFSSAFAAAKYLQLHGHAGSKVLVIGEPGMAAELSTTAQAVNVAPELVQGEFDLDGDQGAIKAMIDSGDISAVVAGFDSRYSYVKSAYAGSLLRYAPSTLFLATNRDMTYPTASGLQLPGGGTVVRALEGAAGRSVDVVAGKPSPVLMELIAAEIGLTRDEASGEWPALMVGDRLDTDIAFGNAVGIPTLLVLSGVTDEAALAEVQKRAAAADADAPWSVEDLFDPTTIPPHLMLPTFVAADVGVIAAALALPQD